uniref:F-box domain-containing protein n=1 Tax=Onchocerca volvulus TaxID=6282 RepID=A0A8R1U2S1_ONCVO
MDMDDLPDLVLELVFSYLNQYGDLENVRLVNRRWHRLACTVINILKKSFFRCDQLIWELHAAEKDENGGITKRCSHSGCYHDGTKKMYIFGGCTDNYTSFNDLWSFDLRSRNWRREFIKCAPFPRPKAMAIFVPYKEYLILHGGFSKSSPNPIHQAANFFSEMHMYDTITNKWIETEPSSPVIANHCGCVVDDSLIIFGGSQNSRATNTVYVLDIINKIWHMPSFVENHEDRNRRKSSVEQFLLKSPQPNPRYGSSCVIIDKSHLLVVGGCGGPNCIYNDAWLLTFDLTMQTAWEWKQINITNPEAGPSQLWCHPACPIGRNLAYISYARKNSGYSTISLNSYPAPLHITSRNPIQLPLRPVNSSTMKPSNTSNLKYDNGTFGTATANSEKNWCRKKRLGNACVYILDTARVLEDFTLTWRQQEIDSNAPEDTMLYSLCAGRAELIMFGGMRSDMHDDNRSPFIHTISNDIYVLSPARLI